jgi:hypothetical protein
MSYIVLGQKLIVISTGSLGSHLSNMVCLAISTCTGEISNLNSILMYDIYMKFTT